MAPHSSTLAWKIPEAGEPGGLMSVGLRRVGHDWSDLATAPIPILVKLFQKISEEETLLKSFYEATITLISKPGKNNTKKIKGQYH